MKTRLIIGALLIFVIVFSFAGLAGAQPEGVPYVPPPVPPVVPPAPPVVPPVVPPDVTPPDVVAPPVPPVDVPVDLPPTPPTAGGMLQAYGMLIGLVLLGSALPLRRR